LHAAATFARALHTVVHRYEAIEWTPRMNANDWLRAFAEKLGTTAPTTEEFKAILDLAAEAAHASERVAAPAATWLAARAGADISAAVEAAKELTATDA
jgi:Domain of unknown function (DUF6457)